MSPILTNAILQSASVAYVLADNTLAITEAGGAERLLPASASALVGSPLLDVYPALRARRERLAALRSGAAARVRWRQRAAGGPSLSATLVPYGEPAKGGFLLTLRFSDAGRPQRRSHTERKARRPGRSPAEPPPVPLMLSATMHELRTPLTVVTGYLSLLLDGACGALTQAQADALEAVGRNVQQIQQLTADLLDTARISSGQLALRPKALDLRRLIARVVEDYRPQLEARGQRVAADAPHDLPQVWCDELRATQIFMNLISNASKYSPDGGMITVSMYGDAGGGFVHVAIADSGIGIALSDQQRVFTPFYRASNIQHSAVVGSGLGLYVTRALVEAHGGTIWLDSTPQVGTTFFLTLPQTAPVEARWGDA